MKSKKLKSALSSVLVMTSLINTIVIYAGDGDEPEKESFTAMTTISEEDLKRKCIQSLAKYADARSKFKLKEINREYKDVVENMPADVPVEYLRIATRREYNTPILNINRTIEADFFKNSSKFWDAKHNLIWYDVSHINDYNIKQFIKQDSISFRSFIDKILKLGILSEISRITRLIELLVDEFENKNPDYFEKIDKEFKKKNPNYFENDESTKDKVLKHIRCYYLVDSCFYCPVGEKLEHAEEIDKIVMPVLKYIELFFSDFNVFKCSETYYKFFSQKPKITLDIAKKYDPWNLSKNPQGDEQYERILTKHEIAKRVLSQWFRLIHKYYMVVVTSYKQEKLPENLKHLAIFLINVTEELINAVFVEKDKKAFNIEEVENICESGWMGKKLKILENMMSHLNTHSLAIDCISCLGTLKNNVKDLKSGRYDKLIEYLKSED